MNFPMYSIRIFDLENEGQGRYRFRCKLAYELTFVDVHMFAKKTVLLCQAVCSRWHFVTCIRTRNTSSQIHRHFSIGKMSSDCAHIDCYSQFIMIFVTIERQQLHQFKGVLLVFGIFPSLRWKCPNGNFFSFDSARNHVTFKFICSANNFSILTTIYSIAWAKNEYKTSISFHFDGPFIGKKCMSAPVENIDNLGERLLIAKHKVWCIIWHHICQCMITSFWSRASTHLSNSF